MVCHVGERPRGARDEALDRRLFRVELRGSRRRLEIVVHGGRQSRKRRVERPLRGGALANALRQADRLHVACEDHQRVGGIALEIRPEIVRVAATNRAAAGRRCPPAPRAGAPPPNRHPPRAGKRDGTAPTCRFRPAAAETAFSRGDRPVPGRMRSRAAARFRTASRPRSVPAASPATATKLAVSRSGWRSSTWRKNLIRVAGAAPPSASTPPRARIHFKHCSIHATRSASGASALAPATSQSMPTVEFMDPHARASLVNSATSLARPAARSRAPRAALRRSWSARSRRRPASR